MFVRGRRKGRRGRKGLEEEEGAIKKDGREEGGIMEMGQRRKGRKEKEMEAEREKGVDPDMRLWRYGLQVFLRVFLKEGLGLLVHSAHSLLCYCTVSQSGFPLASPVPPCPSLSMLETDAILN